jgi:Xaa-Pro aminopeptidase
MAGHSGIARVGLAAPRRAGPSWREYADLELETGALEDVTELVADLTETITPADVEGSRDTVRLLERGISAFASEARTSMSELEAAALIEGECRKQGAVYMLVFVSAGPYLGQLPQARPILRDGLVTVLVEAANKNGYWAEVGAIFAGPDTSRASRSFAESSIAACAQASALISAGVEVGAFARGMVAELDNVGSTDRGGIGHGVGIDECRPTLSIDNSAVLRAGSIISVHPSIQDESGSIRITVANTYEVTGRGPVPLSRAPETLWQLKC